MKLRLFAASLGAVLALFWGGPALAGSTNGSAGDMPAFYDGELFTINLKELPPDAERSVLAHNKSINHIYMSDQAVSLGFDFISVLDAIQGTEKEPVPRSGFNPLWQEVQIVFNGTNPVHQFGSDNDILAAASGSNPEITLVFTTQVYRCSVIGPTK